MLSGFVFALFAVSALFAGAVLVQVGRGWFAVRGELLAALAAAPAVREVRYAITTPDFAPPSARVLRPDFTARRSRPAPLSGLPVAA